VLISMTSGMLMLRLVAFCYEGYFAWRTFESGLQ
jgi:hypothetical protein